MIPPHRPADPAVHEAAMRMARRFVHIIQAILMDNEKPEALRQAYEVAREGLEGFKPCEDTARSS